MGLIEVQGKELACQEYLQELLVIVPEPRPREADGFSSVRYDSSFLGYSLVNRTIVRLLGRAWRIEAVTSIKLIAVQITIPSNAVVSKENISIVFSQSLICFYFKHNDRD